ncbi:WD40 repeat-like protein [Sanghuangporus baumii]|uniref:WD40 repeat-like protein n=1 Tax=Sanghuangporus baumii TaxID=108892 RepID=A0A9Q5I4H4_SANBA|nr:WD40 repeat-like protein [Sanghuangporus baumii]
MSANYRLRIIRVEDLTWENTSHGQVPDLFVKVKFGDDEKKTQPVVISPSPTWDASFPLKCANGETAPSLTPTGTSSIASAGRIVLYLVVIDTMTSADISLEAASGDIRRRNIIHSERASDITRSIRDHAPEMSSQRHLYEAHGSGLYLAVEKVFKTDKKVIDLVRRMVKAFDFVRDVQTLQDKSDSLQQTIAGLLKQTIECCLFVSQYSRRSFLGRMFDVSSDERVDEFERSLAGFKQQIESGVILHTAIVSMRVPEGINDVCRYDAFDRPLCLPETRVEIRSEIVEWVFQDSKQNILWLHGVAGSGHCQSDHREAFWEYVKTRRVPILPERKSDPSSVIRTIAYKFALLDSSIGSSILSEAENDKGVDSALAEDQFRKLLLQPLYAAAAAVSSPVHVSNAFSQDFRGSRSSLVLCFRRHMTRVPEVMQAYAHLGLKG